MARRRAFRVAPPSAQLLLQATVMAGSKPLIAVGMAIVLLGAVPREAHAEGATPLFRADFTAAAAPLHGFTVLRDGFLNTAWQLEQLPGGGPSGAHAVGIQLLGVASPTENYVGWFKDMAGVQVPQGAARYVRMRIRLVSPISYQSVTNGTAWSSKMVILGDTGESSNRVMWNLRQGASATQPVFVIEKNIDGGATRITTTPLPVDTWISAQLKIQSSTTAGSGDGRFSLYLGADNASESTPTLTSGTFSIGTADFDALLTLGYYCDYMRPGGHVEYRFSAFEYDDAFDPTWNAGTSPTGPADASADAASADAASPNTPDGSAADGRVADASAAPADPTVDPTASAADDAATGCALGAGGTPGSGLLVVAVAALVSLVSRARRRP